MRHANHSDRNRRVSELLRRELSALIRREVADPRAKNAAVTAVTLSRDYKQATVFVSCADAGADAGEVEQTLNRAAKFLRGQLAERVNLRSTPALKFKYDHSIRRGMEMSALIDSLNG